MRIESMSRFAGGKNGDRAREGAQINRHPHGRQVGHFIGVGGGIPGRRVYQGTSTGSWKRTPVENPFDDSDSGLAERLIAKRGGVQSSPAPLGWIFSQRC